MWARSTDTYPRGNLNIIKVSIREMPVTISAFSIGMLLNAMMVSWLFFFMPDIPRHAAVPIAVAPREAVRAMAKVFITELIISLFWNISLYHRREKPVKTDIDLLSLKDRTVRARIGRYRNSMIITMYTAPITEADLFVFFI